MNNNLTPLVRRCPRLGGPVGFSYCMRCEQAQPCLKVVDCWWEAFDIIRYLQDNLPKELFDRVMSGRPRSKIVSLVETVERVKQRLNE